MNAAFVDAARRVLGKEATLDVEVVKSDPPDEQAVARAKGIDGVIELSFSATGDKARLHCYVSREQRWLDREISFGQRRASPRSEINERGRLLGFAVATLFSREPETAPEPATPPPAPTAEAAPVAAPAPVASTSAAPVATARASEANVSPTAALAGSGRMVEFAGIASSGLNGTAGALGASAGIRFQVASPLWVRGFASGRTGNISPAQASTRTVLLGAGLAVNFLPDSARFDLGARLDAGASYLDVSHLSEDDVSPDRKSRWLPGGDVMAEAGLHLTSSAGLAGALGVEGILGKTEIYTHGNQVAVVPVVRVLAEVGFRARF